LLIVEPPIDLKSNIDELGVHAVDIAHAFEFVLS